SLSPSPDEASMRIFCSLPVALSFADTCRIPFASISNVTSTCGTPRGAGGMPVSWNLRSEEHTSELQSRGHLVCGLLLEKKNEKRERSLNVQDCRQSNRTLFLGG